KPLRQPRGLAGGSGPQQRGADDRGPAGAGRAAQGAGTDRPSPVPLGHRPWGVRHDRTEGAAGLERRRAHIAVGMEGAPGHQAIAEVAEGLGPSNHAQYFGDARPRGFYRGYPTLGGYDQMTARLGGFWDAMLGEGRRWWITATSDSHIHWRDGGGDFWPGEYSKTYILAAKDHDAILESLRAGRVFVTTGDLISELWVSARGGEA